MARAVCPPSIHFSPADITDRTPAAHAFVVQEIAHANLGWFTPFSAARPTIYYGMLGGANGRGGLRSGQRPTLHQFQ